MKHKYAVPLAFGLVLATQPAKDAAKAAYDAFINNQKGIERVVHNSSGNKLEELLGGVAYGQSVDRISVEEYYQRAKPADEIAPGLRTQDFGYASISTHGFSFYGNEWADAYKDKTEKGEKLRNIFKKEDKQIFTFDGINYQFNFDKFNSYWTNLENDIRFVNFAGNFMMWNVPKERKVYILTLDNEIIEKIKNYSKSFKFKIL